jgi:Domain of unknown function (DUF222)
MSSIMSPGMHPVLAALEVIETGLDNLGEANLWSLLDDESLEVRERLERLSSRLYGAKLASTRDVDSRGAAVKAGATSLRAWLINRVHLHPGEATREVLLAHQLDTDLPATSAALAAGTITPAAASVIAESDAALRKVATAAERTDAEALLVEFAATSPVRNLSHAAIHLRNRLDPDQGERLEKEEEDQVTKREFKLTPNPDGSSRPGGYLDKEATAFLRAALDPLAKPRPAGDGIPDPRTPAQRNGDALVELVELALRSGDLPTQAGQPVQLVVTIGLGDLEARLARAVDQPAPGAGNYHRSPRDAHEQFTDHLFPDDAGTALRDAFARFGAYRDQFTGAGVGVLDDGTPVSAAMVRRWACDCQLIPIVLGSHSEPLDVGRASRDPSPALRRAANARDQGCAFPGCDRPPKWCITHHIAYWEHGGETSLTNLVLLCGHHHRVVHHHGWDVHIETDGLPSFYPPTWIDPDRAPRRHIRYPPHPPPNTGAPDHGNATVLSLTRRT